MLDTSLFTFVKIVNLLRIMLIILLSLSFVEVFKLLTQTNEQSTFENLSSDESIKDDYYLLKCNSE